MVINHLLSGMILQMVNKLIQIDTKPLVLGVNKLVVRKENAKVFSNMPRRFNNKKLRSGSF